MRSYAFYNPTPTVVAVMGLPMLVGGVPPVGRREALDNRRCTSYSLYNCNRKFLRLFTAFARLVFLIITLRMAPKNQST